MTVYLSSAYLAPVEYYTKLLAYDQIYICLLYTSPSPRDCS